MIKLLIYLIKFDRFIFLLLFVSNWNEGEELFF